MDPALSPSLAPAFPLTPPAERISLRITGPIGAMRLPDACAHCGAPPAGTLHLQKMFRRASSRSDLPTSYHFGALNVPFCGPCLAQHERELTPIDPAVTRRLLTRYAFRALIYVGPIGAILYVLSGFGGGLLQVVRKDGLFDWGVALLGGAVLFLGFVLKTLVDQVRDARSLLMGGTWVDPNETYVRLVPTPMGGHYIIAGEPTRILASVDFTDDRSELFDGERHLFRFTDPVFGAQCAALNAERIWDGSAPKARRARWLRKVTIAAILLFGVYSMLIDWLHG